MSIDDAQLTASVIRYAAQRVLHYLETSESWTRMNLAEGQFHTGDDPILADDEAQREFVSSARAHPAYRSLNILDIVGEENIVTLPRQYKPGARVFVLDALDGSTAWAMVRHGYCVACISLLADDSGTLRFECGVVATPVHAFTLLGYSDLKFGATFSASDNDVRLLSALPESDFRPPSLAINGFKARDRSLIVNVMSNLPRWDIVTLGGNPMNPYVVIGALTATVNTQYQCTWDALGVLMCTATDVVVGDIEGTIVSGPAFQSLFARVLLAGNVKIIPPMIVAKNPERFHEIAGIMAKATADNPPPETPAP